MRTFDSLDDLATTVDTGLGESDWLAVDQAQIDLFADATGDHQWIHVDAERTRHGPFGTTVAHGYLTLSLLARLLPTLFEVNGISMAVNYGLNKVRFPAPVPSGSRIRATATISGVESVGSTTQLTLDAAVHIEGGGKPACVAQALIRCYP